MSSDFGILAIVLVAALAIAITVIIPTDLLCLLPFHLTETISPSWSLLREFQLVFPQVRKLRNTEAMSTKWQSLSLSYSSVLDLNNTLSVPSWEFLS